MQVWQKSLGKQSLAAVGAPKPSKGDVKGHGVGKEWGAELELHFRHLEPDSGAAELDSYQSSSEAAARHVPSLIHSKSVPDCPLLPPCARLQYIPEHCCRAEINEAA